MATEETPFDNLAELRQTVKNLDEFDGENIRTFLYSESERLKALGIQAEDSSGFEADEYLQDLDLWARWILGQLVDYGREDMYGILVITAVLAWRDLAVTCLSGDEITTTTTGETK